MYLPKSSKSVFAVTTVAVALIWLAGLFVPSHSSLEPLRWAPFPPPGDAWTTNGWPEAASFDDGVTLRSNAAGVNRLSFAVPLERPVAERTWLQISGRVVEEERVGDSWATAVIGLGFVSAAGETFGYQNLRVVPARATQPERFSAAVEWPAGAVEARVSLHSRPGAPTFSLLEGSAEFVDPNPFYSAALAVLAVVGVVWLVALYRFARAHEATVLLVAPGVVTLAILAGVSMSSQVLRPLMTPFLMLLEGGFGVDRRAASIMLMKGGHAFAFFLLTLGLLSLRRRIRVRRTHLVVFAALLAIGSEGVQSHLSGRNGNLQDVVIDLVGVVLALIAFQLVAGRSRSRTKKARRRTDGGDLATGIVPSGALPVAVLDAAGADSLIAARADSSVATDASAPAVAPETANAFAGPAVEASTRVPADPLTDPLDATLAFPHAPSLVERSDEPPGERPDERPATVAPLTTVALWRPDIDLGPLEPAPGASPEDSRKERRRRSRRRPRGVRGRLSKALSW